MKKANGFQAIRGGDCMAPGGAVKKFSGLQMEISEKLFTMKMG
jgi:hypothetical protein